MRASVVVPVLVAAVLLTGCAPDPSPTTSPTSRGTPTPTPTVDPIADLSLPQRVGQLFMVGTTTASANPAAVSAITNQHVGGIFLHSGARTSIQQTAALVSRFTDLVTPASTGGVELWVSTDQEGGEVQVLSGAGFAAIPSAVEQGGLADQTLVQDAEAWGEQLAQAGVNVNLAPVADIVTSPQAAPQNKPIGALFREYGFDEQTVADKAGAFAAGMRQAGVLPTFKHFPGLGRTDSNTDFAPAIDTVITPSSPDVDVYRSLISGGPRLVMVSTAIYQMIDGSAPAAFSPTVVAQLLRGTLGYDGVVITDDLSAAASVARWTPAQRATLAIDAGCDVVLVSTNPGELPEMYAAVLARAQSDPAFAQKVDAAARRVVAAKLAGTGGD